MNILQLLEFLGQMILWIGVGIAALMMLLVLYMLIGIPVLAIRNALRARRRGHTVSTPLVDHTPDKR